MNHETIPSSEMFPDLLLSNIGVQERVQIKIDPRDNSNTYLATPSSQPVMRFALPNSYYINLYNISLKLLNVQVSGGTTPSINNGIWSLFQRIRILYNSTVLVDFRNYNLFEAMMYQATASTSISTTLAKVFGVDTQANRRTWAANGREYIFYPFRHICQNKLLPLPLLKGYFYIEFYLANPNTCVESATSITSISITSPQMIADGVVPSEQYENDMKNLISGGKLNYLWSGFEYYINTCTSSSNQIKIPHSCKSMKKIYAVQRLGANIGDISVNGKLDNYNFNGTSEYQFKINNLMLPSQPVNVTSTALEPYFNTLRTVYDQSQIDDPYELFKDLTNITFDNYVTNKFIIGHQFDKYKANGSGNITSGLDLTNTSSGIIHTVKMNTTADNNIEHFVEYDKIIMVTPSGDMTVSE